MVIVISGYQWFKVAKSDQVHIQTAIPHALTNNNLEIENVVRGIIITLNTY